MAAEGATIPVQDLPLAREDDGVVAAAAGAVDVAVRLVARAARPADRADLPDADLPDADLPDADLPDAERLTRKRLTRVT